MAFDLSQSPSQSQSPSLSPSYPTVSTASGLFYDDIGESEKEPEKPKLKDYLKSKLEESKPKKYTLKDMLKHTKTSQDQQDKSTP